MKNKIKIESFICVILIFVLILAPPFSYVSDAEKSAETKVEETGMIKGTIQMPEGVEIENIQILAYDLADYEEEGENIPVTEVFSDEEGNYEIKELLPGEYRLEFFSPEENFDIFFYELIPLPEEAEYQIESNDGSDEEKNYFAFAEVTLEAGVEFELPMGLQERLEEWGEPEAFPEEETAEPEEIIDFPEEEMVEPEEAIGDSEEAVVAPKEVTEESTEDSKEVEKDLLKSSDYAGATFEEQASIGLLKQFSRMITGTNWSFDVYYVNEDDRYNVEKTSNFSLKYQMDFHTSEDLAANSVEIRIPATLFMDRDGNAVRPLDFGIPMGTIENPTPSKVSPFNYYIDEATDELVFFNYQDIVAGNNSAFQVLYKNIKLMEVVDETTWELQPTITVEKNSGEKEQGEPRALTGTVDSGVNITKVNKKAYNDPRTNYSPGLYTKKQVEKYIEGTLPEKFETNFDEYVYTVWRVDVAGNATQPWNLRIKDDPTNNLQTGEVVGYLRDKRMDLTPDYLKLDLDTTLLTEGSKSGYITGIEGEKEEEFKYDFFVVTAYPKSSVTEGTELSNDITIVMEPYDEKDPDEIKTDTTAWTYQNYKWVYKGDTIGVKKEIPPYYPANPFHGWLDVYKQAVLRQEDKGDFEFRTYSVTNGYGMTHITEGDRMGEEIPNTSYTMTTVDDVLYAQSSNQSGDLIMMNDQDYYFSSVRITQRDYGYDIWEDRTTIPKTGGDLTIYAMFAGSNTWEAVATVPWQENGIITYNFTEEDLAKQPWRVKAAHNAVDYSTHCNINVSVRLRYDSPVFGAMVAENPDCITVQNLSGVMGERFQDGVSKGYFQDQSEKNYEQYPDNLMQVTKQLYNNMLIQRDNASVDLFWLTPKAASYKSAKAVNDPQNGRVNVNYVLTAYDGYQLYEKEAVNYLTGSLEIIVGGGEGEGGGPGEELNPPPSGLASPGRNEVVFYDLLPYGVQFDQSVPIKVGRTTGIINEPGDWSTAQVRVTVDPQTDIIQNYNGTGRTMVRFNISYDGADSAFYSSKLKMWMEGWGISFGTYYEWKDMDIVQKVENISAFMPARDDNTDLLGGEGEVAKDNGQDYPAGLEHIYKDFGADIDGDNNTEERTVLYAHAEIKESFALASESKIEKLVRADSDRFGRFEKSAIVESGGGYTYDISLSNTSGILEDIVIFDRLENASVDRDGTEEGFDSVCWHGTFAGIQTKALDELGIAPVIYYNADRLTAALPSAGETAYEVLTEANGWYTKERWKALGKPLSEVQAFAVDISRTTEGQPFQLLDMESVSFQVKMIAPDGSDATYAYNNPSFYSYESKNTNTQAWVEGNTVKVELAEPKDLEVEKAFQGEVPDKVSDTKFEFTVYQMLDGEKSKLANRAYDLYQLDDSGQWQKAFGLYATNANGKFYLKAGEKAVFSQVPAVETILVEESESPYWKQTIADTTDEEKRQLLFHNEFQPVIYAQKKVAAVPKGVDITNEVFTFQLLVNGMPASNQDFWYVDRARTDGGIPNKDASKGNNGKGTTDIEGKFTIQAGDVIALFPGVKDAAYTLKEVDGAGPDSNWICKEAEVSGTVPVLGEVASITNYYRWKDLYLTKKVTNQNTADCDQAFTFRITDEDGNPVTGNSWMLMKDGANTGTSGILDANGELTCACAGGVIRIEGLEAGKTYVIEETVSGDLYQAVNDGIAEVTMPLHSMSEKVELTNDYLKRPLSVSKRVLYDEADVGQISEIKEKEFTMTAWLNGELLKNTTYYLFNSAILTGVHTTDENGSFSLKSGERAVFSEVGMKGDNFVVRETPDPDYGQIFPIDGNDHEGILLDGDNAITFINGDNQGGLLLQKEFVAENDGAREVLEASEAAGKKLEAKVYLEVTEANGETYLWPKTDQTVTLIDEWNGTVTSPVWAAGEGIMLRQGELIRLNGLDADVKYRLYEDSAYQHRVINWKAGDGEMEMGSWLEISQKTPKSDQALTGVVGENPMAVLVNSVTKLELKGSRIHKEMEPLSSELVPTGAKLVWRLEEYNGTVWNPKEGVSYLVFDNREALGEAANNQTMVTGTDGLLTLTKSLFGFPSVQFLDAMVRLNYTSGMQAGDLRLVEVMEESDPEWGYLCGYAGIGNNDMGGGEDEPMYGMNVSSDKARGFVNSNRMMEVEIEKKMEDADGTSFTMILEQVLGTSAAPVTEKEQILSTEAKGGITYAIYDSETDELLGESVTTAKGEIFIKAGQYVKLQVPDQTLWTVREQVVVPYQLVEMSASSEESLTKLDENLMLIQFKPEEVLPITLTDEMVKSGVEDIFGNHVNLVEGDVVIPQYIMYEGQKRMITTIGENAFYDYDNSRVTKIKIPDSVTVIEEGAFVRCKKLTEVNIPDGVTEIQERTFSDCESLLDIKIPDNVTAIGASAFYNCVSLTEINIPDGVTTIGERAFSRCSNITKIEIPNNVTEIGDYAFAECNQLTEINIPYGITKIGQSTFDSCYRLERIEIPNSVTEIGGDAFYSCQALEAINIPDSVTTIGTRAFAYCPALTEIPDSVTTIGLGQQSFAGCTNLTKIKITDNVTSIGYGAFWGCSSLESIEIPDSVKTLDRNVFTYCSNLKSIVIPNSVTAIGTDTFKNCTVLTSIKINRSTDAISGSPWGAPLGKVIVQWTGTN